MDSPLLTGSSPVPGLESNQQKHFNEQSVSILYLRKPKPPKALNSLPKALQRVRGIAWV